MKPTRYASISHLICQQIFHHCINMYVNMLLAMKLIIVALKISWPPTSLQRLNPFFTQILLLDLFVSFFSVFSFFWGVLFSSVFLCVSVFFSISLNIYCPSIHHHRRHHHLHNDNVGDGKISQQREFYTNIKWMNNDFAVKENKKILAGRSCIFVVVIQTSFNSLYGGECKR